MHLKSVQSANDQAMVVAKAIWGVEEPYTVTPSFWSNQYDLRLQAIRLSGGYDGLVLRGNPHSRSFSVLRLRGGKVVALDCVNCPRDYSHGRLLIAGHVAQDRKALADAGIQLRTLAQS